MGRARRRWLAILPVVALAATALADPLPLVHDLCQRWSASAWDLSSCIDALASYNGSGDTAMAPFDPPGAADTLACGAAASTPCTVLSPSSCR